MKDEGNTLSINSEVTVVFFVFHCVWSEKEFNIIPVLIVTVLCVGHCPTLVL